MKRVVVKTVGWFSFLLAIVVFLLPGPVRKGDYATMLETAVAEASAKHPDWVGTRELARIEATAERLAAWSRALERMHRELQRFAAVVLLLAGLLLIQVGSWIPRPPQPTTE